MSYGTLELQPTRLGGLGIPLLAESSAEDHRVSQKVTENLVHLIKCQSHLTPGDLRQKQGDTCRKIQTEKDKKKQEKFTALSENASQAVKRCLTTATERGSSSWLTVLPLEDEGKSLSKQEFRDALAIRYNLTASNLPRTCVCGTIFDIDHAMTCKRGGYISHRHDRIRDLYPKRLQKVCQDVSIEPHLRLLTGETLQYASANTSDFARLDIKARHFWTRCTQTFFDVRIFHVNCKTNANTRLNQIYNTTYQHYAI